MWQEDTPPALTENTLCTPLLMVSSLLSKRSSTEISVNKMAKFPLYVPMIAPIPMLKILKGTGKLQLSLDVLHNSTASLALAVKQNPPPMLLPMITPFALRNEVGGIRSLSFKSELWAFCSADCNRGVRSTVELVIPLVCVEFGIIGERGISSVSWGALKMNIKYNTIRKPQRVKMSGHHIYSMLNADPHTLVPPWWCLKQDVPVTLDSREWLKATEVG